MTIFETLSKEFNVPLPRVEKTVELIDEGNTIPFIARYRKEVTGSLDDVVLRNLNDRLEYLRNMEKRREEITALIDAQEKLTEEISLAIANAKTLTELDDIYRPFRPHRKTRASVAKEKGLEPLALLILEQKDSYEPSIEAEAEAYISEEKGVANAEEAITYDSKLYGHLFYNVMAYSPYVYGNLPWRQNRGWREWNNADDSYLESYIEKNYKLKSGDKTIKAFSNVVNRFQINPIKETLQECYQNWDGGKYIENLLPDFLGCEKSEYNTEVMKLIMLGAIHRIFKPGCKFDYMLVLVGEQGKGKSTFIRRLALNDQWFDDNFSTVEGVKALEKLRGKWFVELAELQANKRLKDVESMKAFVTSQIDVYRPPYGRRTEERPRMCILTGTSNPTDFLTDRTGNRRFLPVTCRVHTPKHDITKVSALEAKSIFASAWGEAMDIYEHMADKDRLVLPDRLQQMAIDQQEAYTADDPMVGMIQEYLDGLEEDRVCVMQIWENVFDSNIKPGRKEVNILHEIMRNKITGWKASGIQRTGKVYGNQRCYDRISKFAPIDIEEIPFDA